MRLIKYSLFLWIFNELSEMCLAQSHAHSAIQANSQTQFQPQADWQQAQPASYIVVAQDKENLSAAGRGNLNYGSNSTPSPIIIFYSPQARDLHKNQDNEAWLFNQNATISAWSDQLEDKRTIEDNRQVELLPTNFAGPTHQNLQDAATIQNVGAVEVKKTISKSVSSKSSVTSEQSSSKENVGNFRTVLFPQDSRNPITVANPFESPAIPATASGQKFHSKKTQNRPPAKPTSITKTTHKNTPKHATTARTITFPKEDSKIKAPRTIPNAELSSYHSPNTFADFNSDLFKLIAAKNQNRNFVYSAVALHCLMAIIAIGAHDKTGEELQRGLHLPENSKDTLQLFTDTMRTLPQTENAKVIMANKIYYHTDHNLDRRWKIFASRYFQTDVESTKFRSARRSANKMNAWIAQKTDNRIRHIVEPSTLNAETNMVLLNAIYFKGFWQIPFSASLTAKLEFENIKKEKKMVDTMTLDSYLNCGSIFEAKAKVCEMPYKEANISMFIILPTHTKDFEEIEKGLTQVEWHTITATMQIEHVEMHLPKFQVEYGENMMEIFEKLGIKEIFTVNSNLNGMFFFSRNMQINLLTHKAYLDVNEAGSEAATVSFGTFTPDIQSYEFNVDHPFIFVIRSPEIIYFMGHIVDL